VSVTFYVSPVRLSVGYNLLYRKQYSPVKKTTVHSEVVPFVGKVRYIYEVTKSQGDQSNQGHQLSCCYQPRLLGGGGGD